MEQSGREKWIGREKEIENERDRRERERERERWKWCLRRKVKDLE